MFGWSEHAGQKTICVLMGNKLQINHFKSISLCIRTSVVLKYLS